MENKKACTVILNSNNLPLDGEYDEMQIDYTVIKEKVNEMNNLGIDITLKEIGDLIESKFLGQATEIDEKHSVYSLIRYHK
jgi:hypothetical protein